MENSKGVEGMIREASRLTTNCQNEEKLNVACRPAMRKALHDSLPRDAMALIGVEDWSTNKERIHPTRSEASVSSFVEKGLVCITRALLECERRFFNDKTEETFAQSNSEFETKLTDWEKAMIVLDLSIFLE